MSGVDPVPRPTGTAEKRVLVVGASGAIGLPLCARLRAAGHVVFGIHRSAHGAAALRSLGVTPLAPNVCEDAEVGRAYSIWPSSPSSSTK